MPRKKFAGSSSPTTTSPDGNPEYSINPEIAEVLNQWWDEKLAHAMQSETVLDPIGYAIGEMSSELRNDFQTAHKDHVGVVDLLLKYEMNRHKAEVEQMSREIAELRGEVNVLRSGK
jgi:hypothetical protein